MINSKQGTTEIKGDIDEVISDFTVIVNAVYEHLLKGLEKEDATTYIVEHVTAALMSEKEFNKWLVTNDASEKAYEIFKIYNKTRSKLFDEERKM